MKKKEKKPVMPKALLLHISLGINAIFFGLVVATIIYLNSPTGRADTVNRGVDLMCNGQFAADYPNADERLLDYTCSKKGAQQFFNRGFEEYKHSLQ